ncbi:MAG: PQQ-binding-like beta-propeller repeat protein, partial [Rhodospirillales bacterium]|nr:PQQ-binding-like beta-propeller repeat protein [Acetobacter sp.]
MRSHRSFSSPACWLLFLLLSLCVSADASAQLENYLAPGWHSAGQDLANTRAQFDEHAIKPSNVGSLHAKWVFKAGGNVSATPTVAGDAVYFPDFAGNLFAVNKHDGTLLWSHRISDYTGVPGSLTRVSPALHGDHLYIGDRVSATKTRSGADLISINRKTGALEWLTNIEKHPTAVITGSPVVYDGVVYIGVSSGEEGYAEQASYPCCTFRGSIVAVNAHSGKVLWKTYTVPDNSGKPGGYSGASVWSPPAVDIGRQSLYVGTANNYTAPSEVVNCQLQNPEKRCAAQDDYFDSLLALDLKTGHVKWAQHLRTYDIWTLACIRSFAPRANCPLPSSPDSGSGS